jgi:uncharacterized sodium:solute symporter family permease YidK
MLINKFLYFAQITEGSLLDTAESLDITELINRGLAYAIIAAGLLSVIFIFIGGISFILSGGQEDKIKQAVSTIRYAIIGLIVTIFAIIIVNAVGQVIGLNTIEYIRFEEIIKIIQNISQDLQSSNGSGIRTLD